MNLLPCLMSTQFLILAFELGSGTTLHLMYFEKFFKNIHIDTAIVYISGLIYVCQWLLNLAMYWDYLKSF